MSAGRKESSPLRQLLRANSAAIRRVVEAHHAPNPRVFGSVSLGTDTSESDIDLLVDSTSATTLMDIGAIRLELRQLLGVPVDVLTPNALPESCRDRILAAAMPL
jgi:predicted nucleotidyltransferase